LFVRKKKIIKITHHNSRAISSSYFFQRKVIAVLRCGSERKLAADYHSSLANYLPIDFPVQLNIFFEKSFSTWLYYSLQQSDLIFRREEQPQIYND